MSAKTILAKTIVSVQRSTARVALLFTGLLVLPIVGFTAQASAAFSDCSPGNMCVWVDTNAGGARFSWGGSWSGSCWNMGANWNDIISSMYNRMSTAVEFYRHSGCLSNSINSLGGNRVYINPGASYNTCTEAFPCDMNDAISSVYFY